MKIEINAKEKDYNSCNCCRDKNVNVYEISFIYNMGVFGSQGMTISLCKNCLNHLKEKLNLLELEDNI